MTDRLFNSQADIVSGTFSNHLDAGDNTSIDIGGGVFLSIDGTNLNSNADVFHSFVSKVDIVSTTSDINIYSENRFISISNIYSETTIPDIYSENRFISISNIYSETNTPEFNFIGTSNTPTNNNKKLQYLINSLVPEHIQHEYPKYKELIHGYLKYLDITTAKSYLNILNNNNVNHIYKEFIDNYLNDYFNEVIDLNKYGLTDTNKKRFLQLSRFVNNLKGNKKSFDFLFRSFTDIQIAQEDIVIDVDKIIIDFLENEDWWISGEINYHDGIIYRDGTKTREANFARPFTYQFKIDQSKETMLPLIRSVHPAGFNYEFIVEINVEDDQDTDDELGTSTTYYHFRAAGESNKTIYYRDGSIKRTPSRIENDIF